MNIKEIRIKKKLTQQQCADYLTISRRSYQNLESPDVDTTTEKYKYYCYELENYDGFEFLLKTNAIYGEPLERYRDSVKNYKKRFCYKYLLDFIKSDIKGKICILYGLRRTGKTTLLFQLLNELDLKEVAYIKICDTDDMAMLVKDLKNLYEMGIRYAFIDEITLMEDFIGSAATLSDVFSFMGMKIILSGTDSLGFAFADRDELYDRNVMIHTTYISFKEFNYILNIKDIDSYIEYGGTFKVENMTFNDPDYKNDEVSFANNESTRKYIDTAISRNIQNSLKNNELNSSFAYLKALYEKNELTNAINRIIEDMNHDFLVSVITRKFKSHDLGSSKQMLLKKENTSLYEIDEEKVLSSLKNILDIKEKDELSVLINDNVINQIKEYLYKLDLIRDVEIRYENGQKEKRVVFIQPGMRYSITKALVFSLLNDEYFSSLSEANKNYIVETILNDVKGRMLEDIVLLETTLKTSGNDLAFKYVTFTNGEFDLVKYYAKTNTFDAYEIKHSNEISFDNQTKFLRNDSLIQSAERLYGQISNKYVLYRGESTTIDNIQYLNVEEYLTNINN